LVLSQGVGLDGVFDPQQDLDPDLDLDQDLDYICVWAGSVYGTGSGAVWDALLFVCDVLARTCC